MKTTPVATKIPTPTPTTTTTTTTISTAAPTKTATETTKTVTTPKVLFPPQKVNFLFHILRERKKKENPVHFFFCNQILIGHGDRNL